MSNKLIVSDYDFDAVKANLKSFLQGQSQFQDYDFEGSSLNILLDILSYNTHYLAYLANMATNELYLDSADIRNNIVSLAKMIGYTPSSPRAPLASIDVTLNNATGTSVTMSKGTVFTTTVDNTSYQYVTNSDITITPSSGVYKLVPKGNIKFMVEKFSKCYYNKYKIIPNKRNIEVLLGTTILFKEYVGILLIKSTEITINKDGTIIFLLIVIN